MRSLLDLFLPIFIGMGPVKVLLVYMALTKNSSTAPQRKVAIKTIITGTIIAIVLLLAGAFIMKLLHFTTGALSIAGGLILLILALNIVLSPAETKEESGPVSEEALMSMAIYPLAIPILLNPVGIVSLTVFSAEAQGLLQLGVLIILVLVVAAIDLGVFLISHRLDKYLTKERILVLEKLLGVFFSGVSYSVDDRWAGRFAYYYRDCALTGRPPDSRKPGTRPSDSRKPGTREGCPYIS